MVVKLLTTNQVFTPGCWHVANVLIYFLLGGRRLFSCTVLYSCTQVDLTAWGQEWLSVFSWHLERKHQFPNTWEGWPINSCNFLFHILKLHKGSSNCMKMRVSVRCCTICHHVLMCFGHWMMLIFSSAPHLKARSSLKFWNVLKELYSVKIVFEFIKIISRDKLCRRLYNCTVCTQVHSR